MNGEKWASGDSYLGSPMNWKKWRQNQYMELCGLAYCIYLVLATVWRFFVLLFASLYFKLIWPHTRRGKAAAMEERWPKPACERCGSHANLSDWNIYPPDWTFKFCSECEKDLPACDKIVDKIVSEYKDNKWNTSTSL